jgi:iron complex outermembrane receptor protein
MNNVKLFLMLAVAIVSAGVFAQPVMDSLALEEVELIGCRVTISNLFYTSNQVQRVNLDAEKQRSISLQQALESFSGVDLQQRGPFDVQSDVSIRGGTFNQTGIFIDGVPYSDPQTGHHQLNVPFSLQDLSMVEVIPGNTRTLGGQAFAGALNFVLRRQKDRFAHIQAYGGRHGLMGLQVQSGLPLGDSWLNVSAHSSRSNGYRENTDFIQNQANLHVSRDFEQAEVRAFLGYSQKAFGAQSFYSNNYPDQFEAIQGFMGHVKASWRGASWTHRGFVSFRNHSDRFELFREGDDYYSFNEGLGLFVAEQDTAPSWYEGANRHRSWQYQAQYTAERLWSHRHSTVVSGQMRAEGVYSNVLGDSLAIAYEALGGGDYTYARGSQRINGTLAVDHQVSLGSWLMTAGVLYQMNSAFLPEWMPGVEVAYLWGSRFKSTYSLNRSFRLPTFTELYYNVGGAVGSKDLLPESAWIHDVGLEWSKGRLHAQMNVHQRKTANAIDWLEQDNGEIQASNLSEVAFIGADVRMNYGFLLPWIRSVSASYSYLNGSHDFQERSVYALRYLRHQANLSAVHPVAAHWQISWSARLQQRVHVDSPWDRPFALFALNLAYTPEGMWRFELSAENLTNTEFADRNGIVQAGFWPWARISRSF